VPHSELVGCEFFIRADTVLIVFIKCRNGVEYRANESPPAITGRSKMRGFTSIVVAMFNASDVHVFTKR